MRVCLTVSDCPPLEPEGDLPPMPALGELARRADRFSEPGGWRATLWREAFGERAAPPPAVVAAWGADVPVGRGAWLAQPVRLTAAVDHLRLHGAGLLRVDAAEAHDWIAAYESTFGTAPPRLRAIAGGFLLEGFEPGAGPPDPADCLGARLDAGSRGGSKGLRRLAAELELWLHEHPLNARRTRSGKPAISALWLWGGGLTTAPPSRESGTPLQLLGDDAWVVGLGAAIGSPACATVPADAMGESGGATRLIQCSASVVSAREESPLARIDREWIAPLVEALARGRIRELAIAIGRLRFETRRSHRLRWWRRARPWWDTAAR